MDQPTLQTSSMPKPGINIKKILLWGFLLVAALLIVFLVLKNPQILKKSKSQQATEEAKPVSEQTLIEETQKAGLLDDNFKKKVIEKKPDGESTKQAATNAAFPSGSLGFSNLPKIPEYVYYRDQFIYIVAKYYREPSGEKLDLAKKWEQLISQKFPKEYEEGKNQKIFEIVQR